MKRKNEEEDDDEEDSKQKIVQPKKRAKKTVLNSDSGNFGGRSGTKCRTSRRLSVVLDIFH